MALHHQLHLSLQTDLSLFFSLAFQNFLPPLPHHCCADTGPNYTTHLSIEHWKVWHRFGALNGARAAAARFRLFGSSWGIPCQGATANNISSSEEPQQISFHCDEDDPPPIFQRTPSFLSFPTAAKTGKSTTVRKRKYKPELATALSAADDSKRFSFLYKYSTLLIIWNRFFCPFTKKNRNLTTTHWPHACDNHPPPPHDSLSPRHKHITCTVHSQAYRPLLLWAQAGSS